jgi:hypothetical protein
MQLTYDSHCAPRQVNPPQAAALLMNCRHIIICLHPADRRHRQMLAVLGEHLHDLAIFIGTARHSNLPRSLVVEAVPEPVSEDTILLTFIPEGIVERAAILRAAAEVGGADLVLKIIQGSAGMRAPIVMLTDAPHAEDQEHRYQIVMAVLESLHRGEASVLCSN